MRHPPDRGAAFTALYETHCAAVLAYARRRVRPAEVDDVAAEIWTVAWRRIDDVPADHALAWLLTCGRHVISARSRGEGRSAAKHRAAEILSDAATPDHAAGVVEGDAIRTALARLRPADQEVLRLVAWDDLAPADAARVLGITRLAFNQRLSRARRRLQRHLDDLEHHVPAPVPARTLRAGEIA